MKIQYSIEKNDILVNHLYVVSKMEKFKSDKKEIFISFLLPIVLIGLVALYKKRYFDSLFILLILIVMLAFYQKIINFYYKSYYSWSVKRLIKNNPNILGDKSIEIIEKDNISIEINSINEIKEYFFIRLKNKTSITIPKTKITSNSIEEVSQFLMQLSKNHNIEYIKDLDWKWN